MGDSSEDDALIFRLTNDYGEDLSSDNGQELLILLNAVCVTFIYGFPPLISLESR